MKHRDNLSLAYLALVQLLQSHLIASRTRRRAESLITELEAELLKVGGPAEYVSEALRDSNDEAMAAGLVPPL